MIFEQTLFQALRLFLFGVVHAMRVARADRRPVLVAAEAAAAQTQPSQPAPQAGSGSAAARSEPHCEPTGVHVLVWLLHNTCELVFICCALFQGLFVRERLLVLTLTPYALGLAYRIGAGLVG